MSEKTDIVDDFLGPCTTTDGRPVHEARAAQAGETGQHKSYIVLKPEARIEKVRPYRDRYKHKTCGGVTSMGRALSETYQANPKFYSHTYCLRCDCHPPVSEFTWTLDGEEVGS